MAVAILLGVRAARRPGIGGFLLCGVATGASYLVRPEGLLVAFAVGGVILLAWASRRWPRVVALGRLTALCVGVALVALPYMVLIGKLTNKPTREFITNLRQPEARSGWEPGNSSASRSSRCSRSGGIRKRTRGRTALWADAVGAK